MEVLGIVKNKGYSDGEYYCKVLSFEVSSADKEKKQLKMDDKVGGFFMENKILPNPFTVISLISETLTHALLRSCDIDSLEGLSSFKNLVFLRMDNNKISSIPDGSLPEKLRFLCLRSNKINLIGNQAMVTLVNYERVDMKNNSRIDFEYTKNASSKEDFMECMKMCTGPPEGDESMFGEECKTFL